MFQTCPNRQHRDKAAATMHRESFATVAAQTDSSRNRHMTNEVQIERRIARFRNTLNMNHTMDETAAGSYDPQIEREDTQLSGGVNTDACTEERHEAVTANQQNTRYGDDVEIRVKGTAHATLIQTTEDIHGYYGDVTQLGQQHRVEEMGVVSDRDDSPPDVMDTSHMQQCGHMTQDNATISPKPTKKKVEKNIDQQNERTRNMIRRAALKLGKT